MSIMAGFYSFFWEESKTDSKESSKKIKILSEDVSIISWLIYYWNTVVKHRERKGHTRNAAAISGSSGLITCSKN